LPLNEQQRQQIYTAVMADNSGPAPDATELKPGIFLSFDQARDLHALPPTRGGNRRVAWTKISERQEQGFSGAATERGCRRRDYPLIALGEVFEMTIASSSSAD
jgi:hypothetical protein